MSRKPALRECDFLCPRFAPVFWALTWAAVVAVAKRSHCHPERSEGPAFASASPNPPSIKAALDLLHREGSSAKGTASQAAEKIGVALDFGWRSGSPARFRVLGGAEAYRRDSGFWVAQRLTAAIQGFGWRSGLPLR